MTLKLRILRSLTRLFITLVSLTRSLFSEKMLISNRCIIGLMSNLIKKSWTVSNLRALVLSYLRQQFSSVWFVSTKRYFSEKMDFRCIGLFIVICCISNIGAINQCFDEGMTWSSDGLLTVHANVFSPGNQSKILLGFLFKKINPW